MFISHRLERTEKTQGHRNAYAQRRTESNLMHSVHTEDKRIL